MKPIFIAGPHGSGKTTLISKLIVKSDRFIKDDYEIDFSNDMETLSSMTIFEKCLIRLYHRFYTAELAIKKCGMSKENDKILVVDRSIYDSLVYIEVEYKLGELSDEQYHKLREIVDNSLAMIEPYTVVLNPNPEEIVRRLEIRRATGTRKKRDQMCAREDNVDYVGKMNDEFIKIYSNKNVININNNEDEDIKKINDCSTSVLIVASCLERSSHKSISSNTSAVKRLRNSTRSEGTNGIVSWYPGSPMKY